MSYLLRGCWLLLLCCLCSSALAAEKLTVAAASDLRFALNDILQAFTSQYPEQTSAQPIQVIYGSSGKISQQIPMTVRVNAKDEKVLNLELVGGNSIKLAK